MKEKENNIPWLSSLEEFRAFLFHKILRVSDLMDRNGEPLKKVIAFWRRNELLPFLEYAKWNKLSFAHLIWIRILDDLRAIGYTIENMQKVRDYFFRDAYTTELWKQNLEYNIKRIESKGPHKSLSRQEKMELHLLHVSLDEPGHLKYDVNYLTMLINISICQELPAYIFIYFDGHVEEYLGDNYVGHKKMVPFDSQGWITLPLNKYLSEFIAKSDLDKTFSQKVMTSDEIRLFQEIRKENVTEVHASKTTGKSNLKINTVETRVIKSDQAATLKKILKMTNYEEILIKTIDEQSVLFTKTKKNI